MRQCGWSPVVLAVAALSLGCGPTSKSAPVAPSGAGSGEEAASCEPGRCLEDISRVIQADRAKARACYEAGLKRQPGLEGRLIINFEIDAEGAVIDASQGMQDNQITEEEVVSCVSGVVREIRFARSASGKATRAYHRFEFSPP